MALLSTEDSKSVGVLYLVFTQPSLIRSFHSSDPCFSQRGSDMRGSTVLPSIGTRALRGQYLTAYKQQVQIVAESKRGPCSLAQKEEKRRFSQKDFTADVQ